MRVWGVGVEQFAIIASHPPDQCPTANETIRKLFLNRAPEMPKLAERLGVEYLAGPIISTEHKSVAIVRAKNVESVRNLAIESGMIQWNTVEILHGVFEERPNLLGLESTRIGLDRPLGPPD